MSDEQPRFASLLAPGDCAVVLIDACEDDLGLAAALLEAAEIYGVPTIVCGQPAASHCSAGCTAVPRHHLNPLADPEVRRALAGLRRPRLLIGGGPAETVLAFAVLSALEEGYDVHLLRDILRGAAESLVEIAAARMIQAGAVPVTAVQVIAEWRCLTERPVISRFRKAG